MDKITLPASHIEVESHKIRLPAKKTVMKVAAWIVPVGTLLGSAIFPLRPIIRQGMVGLMAIWLYVLAIFGFDNPEEVD